MYYNTLIYLLAFFLIETEAKKSDGIFWVYVKDCINYNVRNGIFSTDETLNIYG